MRVLFLLLLTGCTGGAGYTYSHISADGSSCSATVDSTRIVSGVAIKVTKDCALTVSAEKLDANADLVKVMGDLVNKIP